MKSKRTIALTITVSIVALVGAGYGILWANLPQLDGQIFVQGPEHPTHLNRDALGTAVIHATNRKDAAFALGYAHGQDRFFQMDILRRNAAGELAELFGEDALALDQKHRFHQFRKRAQLALNQLSDDHRQLLERYAQGVNAALNAQKIKSFEYLLSGTVPARWKPEDSFLVIYSMYLDLQASTVEREQVLERLRQAFGPQMTAFVTQTDPLQAALDNSHLPLTQVDIPPLAVPTSSLAAYQPIGEPKVFGSNNWAVTGQLTTSGHAMISNDMHLGLNVPVIWYRAQLNYSFQGQNIQVTGVSLPGTPTIVVGSNGRVAWGFTNGYIDTADWISLDEQTEVVPVVERLKTPASEVDFPIELSPEGPVTRIGSSRYALSWVAHQPYAVNLELMALETASSVAEGLASTQSAGLPVQNMLITDSQGNAAWRLTGAIPARDDPQQYSVPASAYPATLWQHRAEQVPVVENPAHHRLWSANSRVVSALDDARFGNGGYAIASRAVQIRDNLMARQQFDESDFFQMQLDNQAHFMARWQALLLSQLALHPQRFQEDISYLKQWQGCACAESVGYTLTRTFRDRLFDTVFAPIQQILSADDLSLKPLKDNLEPAIWQLLKAQPTSWLPAGEKDWDSLLINVYVDSREALFKRFSPDRKLADLNWGTVNTLAIQHPFTKKMPQLGWLLNMPEVKGFGGLYEPAVQTRAFGASERFVVQPGREEDGILTIPGGQSANPVSPFFRAGFDDYASHRKTPLLPGEIQYRLTLIPR
ncbi:penicillin acylase family protein [Photobacterium galatheae]|uniref:Hydrolase n=1 Tax=Photobacterium galatheae TaxID=1654360 RepID=A0A066RRZ4_9GAMM|nr:penicillin acylase family protein [Photobacterium galatheae]KDM93175.1 hydrolase [Photobacterium galatheae]MCM0148296.1 penicillin acylase family protein [Photobacterium galatheae]